MHRRSLYSALFVALVVAVSASAQSPEWRFGGRISWVNAGATSDELGDSGLRLDLESGPGGEFDATVMFSDRFAVELSVGGSAHRFQIRVGESGDIDGGRLWLMPLSVIGQYHHPIYGPWDPYVGIGVSWTVPLYDNSQALNDAGFDDIDFEGVSAVVGQIGVNYQIDNRWYVNLDLRYFGASLDVRVSTEEQDFPTVSLDTKPVVFSLGFGYRF